MTRKLDYRWNLRQVMAARGMFQTTDLTGPLADRGIRLSSSQVYRLVTERPERLSLKVLMALLDILECTMDDLIEPAAAAEPAATRGPRAEKRQASGACGPEEPGSRRTAAARDSDRH
jgi:DNA-binding Xre family transcriptional regulator